MRFIQGHNSVGVDRSGPRIKDRYRVEDRGYETPCWIWQLKTNKTGYGYTSVKGKDWLAHRYYFIQERGPIPLGFQLDHLCRQRLCVNPAHLEPVTALVNTRRGRPAKLTLAEAEAIYRDFHAGRPRLMIADQYGISRETVTLIGRNGPHGPRRP